MKWPFDHLQLRPLTLAASEEEFALHLAAIEWSLAEPVIVAGADDLRAEHRWRGRWQPWPHQVQNLVTFCRHLPAMLLADETGLGKSISAGMILSELLDRRRIRRALVICPATIGPQWQDELQTRFGLTATFTKSETPDPDPSPIVITTYDAVAQRLPDLQPGTFDLLIVDEAHKLRTPAGQANPPAIATNLRDALRRRTFAYTLLLTATPIHNRMWDLYALIDLLCLARGTANPLGEPPAFAATYLTDPVGRRLNPLRSAQFRQILRQHVMRTRRPDQKPLPRRDIKTRLGEPQQVDRDCLTLAGRVLPIVDAAKQQAICCALMSSPQALSATLAQLAIDEPKLDSAAYAARLIADRNLTTGKLLALHALVRERESRQPRDWRLIVFVTRHETQTAVARWLEGQGVTVGQLRAGQRSFNDKAMKRVNVIVTSDTAAEGVTMPAGPIVHFDLPWNPVKLQQRTGRDRVEATILALTGQADDRAIARPMEKLHTLAHSTGEVEALLESTGRDDAGLDAELLPLVLTVINGGNVDEAVGKLLESFDRAKDTLDRERIAVDSLFDHDDAQPPDEIRAPKIKPLEPSMPAEVLVQKALSAEGAALAARRDGTLEVRWPGGRVERITFKASVAQSRFAGGFDGARPTLYAPGSEAFEALLHRWIARGGHRIRDLSGSDASAVEQTVRQWCDSFAGARFKSVSVGRRTAQASLTTISLAKASNRFDSLEKLIHTTPAAPPPIGEAELFNAPLLAGTVSPADWMESTDALARDVAHDGDVRAFCHVYAARVRGETAKASDATQKSQVEQDLNPRIAAEVVGLTGVRFDLVQVAVAFEVNGHPYAAELQLIPAANRVTREPARVACAATGQLLPDVCLSPCAVTGQRVLAHLLVRSQRSGRSGQRRFLVTCNVTGQRLLEDETAVSAVSGTRAAKDLLQPSPITGRLGLVEEFAPCAFTGAAVLRDELLVSEESNKPFRKDQAATSEESGKIGHASELVRCAVTGRRLLRSETFVSAVSGVRASASIAMTCAATGELLLPTEAAVSAVSGKTVRVDLLAPSPISGRLGLAEEFAACDITGERVLTDELIPSAATGRRFRRDQAATSDDTGAVGHQSETVVCAISGKTLLTTEAGVSSISGQTVLRRLLLESARSPGRFGLETETLRCAATGRRLLIDEVGTSIVSGKVVDRDLLIACDKSGGLAMENELFVCPITLRRLLPGEAGVSDLSGRRVDAELLQPSPISGRLGLADEFRLCQLTGDSVLADELAISAVSSLPFRKDQAATSAVSGKVAHASEVVYCATTGQPLLPDETALSAVSGLRHALSLLAPSEKTGRLGTESELAVCAKTGKRLLIDETAVSQASGLRVDRELLAPSDLSRKLALPEELVLCGRSARRVLPKETVVCAVTGERVAAAKQIVGLSAVSRRPALLDKMVRCEVSGALALPGELVVCPLSRKKVIPAGLGTCVVSGKRVLKSLLMTSDVSGATLLERFALRSPISRRVCTPTETADCTWLGQKLPRDEVTFCILTGLAFGRAFLNADGELQALRDLLDGRAPGGEEPGLGEYLNSVLPDFASHLAKVRIVSSPDGLVRAVIGEGRGLLGLKARVVGCVVSLRTGGRQVIGQAVIGRRTRDGWIGQPQRSTTPNPAT